MRASLAGLLAACALIGIPRLVSELREYRRESQKPAAPLAMNAPLESRPAISGAPTPKIADTAAPPKPAPVQLVAIQREPPPLAGAGAKSSSLASPPNEADLIPEIQKELTRLGLYDGPITDKWSRPVRSAAREFLRNTGNRSRHPQPKAGLLAMLKAAQIVKKQAATPPEGVRPEEKPVLISGPSVKELPPKPDATTLETGTYRAEGVKETPLKQNVPAPVPATQSDDYLPPWMTAKTDRARFASKSEAARSDEPAGATRPVLAEAPSSFDDPPKRRFHRRHHSERLWKGRRHYVSHRGYYSRRRAYMFPN
jgi:hypothetical protein